MKSIPSLIAENDLPRLKGILLVGIPGTGKSLASKAVASILGWPLIRLDIGALKNSLVGESERRMRQVTHTIDAFGNAVIWIDEVEKAFAGTKSSGETDAGTTASMFGHFLTGCLKLLHQSWSWQPPTISLNCPRSL